MTVANVANAANLADTMTAVNAVNAPTYNRSMKTAFNLLRFMTFTSGPLLVLALAATCSAALAQSNESPDIAPGQRWQHLEQEDSGSKIDEVRIGGETQSLTVQPKSTLFNAPAYEFQLTNGSRRSTAVGPGAESTGSARVWNFLSF